MPEPTIGLTLDQLKAQAGWHLGYGRDSASWDSEQEAVIDDVVQTAQRRVYQTEGIPQLGIPAAYRWSFLRPVRQFTLTDGADAVLMPDDFGSLDGPVTILSSDTSYLAIPIVGEQQIRQAFSLSPEATGIPSMAAVSWSDGPSSHAAQRATLKVYPTADADYTLQVRYSLTPNAMTGTRPFPYGGAKMAELFSAAIRAVCEMNVDGVLGVHNAYFQQRLAAAIADDLRTKGDILGYNGDGTRRRRGRELDHPIVTFGGVEY